MSSDSEPEMHPYLLSTHPLVLNPFVYQDPLRTPAISAAISNNDNERVKSLLYSGKCVNYADNNGNTPLHHAAYLNRTEVIRTLIEHEDIIIDPKNYEGYTPLLLHLSNNPVEEIVMLLLSNGADVKTTSKLDESVLHMAVKHSNNNVVSALIKWGADINAQDYELYTPLIEAVQCNNLELVCLLLYYDADVNIISSSGLTAFMYATMSLRQYDVAKTLFDYYDDFSLVSIYGDTTLSLAAKAKNPIAIDIVKAVGIGYNCCAELLRISLTFDDLEFFKEIWKRIDFTDLTVHHLDLTYAVLHTALPKQDWLDCMYLLLSSSVAQNLISNTSICAKGLFKRLSFTFQQKGIELSDRLQIMCLYLSLGYTTTLADLSAIYEKYGFNEELHLLLDHPLLECDKAEIIHPMVTFILGFEKEICKQYLISLLHKYASCTSIRDSTKNFAAILYTFKFFSVPCIEKHFLIYCSNSDIKLSDRSETPCLVELCRNKIRNHLRLICNIKKSHHIYNVVKRLPIPKTILDILLFKKPLY
ncbi:ankyrin repeat and SOCS box protein 3-like isoform X1 [Photinus pyralis]|uniref:ankyrin repeat and SOCS box protein 3-like isoform X1 n=1 Tax=Photinus pyralis TaxID=7054 RepID=UPI001266FE9F|nr:ankyrin repeat and SOCS box protein 3-like isoform X1 [Photinus pyralis]